jgi:O-antigen/teichoic acid export membrane protein
MSNPKSLKEKILRGGISLSLRQLFVSGLSLINVLVIARILGPERYGIVTIVLGIFYFFTPTLKLGLQVYLVRKSDLSKDEPSQVVAFYSTIGVLFWGLLWFAAPTIGWWTGKDEVTQGLRLVLPALWLDQIARVSISMLERELRFTQVGIIEASAQFVNYLSSVLLVLMGWSYWGPIVGTVLRYVVQAGLSYFFYPIPWCWSWRWQTLKPGLSYGLTYSSSDWLLNIKDLRVSLLVSRLLGVEAAGFISIAIRLADQLAILRMVVRRMSISVMAKLIDDPDKTRSAISRGMVYQTLLIGPTCAVFSCLAAWIVPIVFGEEWLISVDIFPFIAFGTLIGAIFELHASTLYTTGHNYEVARRNGWFVGVLWLASLLLMPSLGLWGYGLAEIIALPTYYWIHLSITKIFGSPDYGNAFWLTLASAIPLFGGAFLPPIFGLGLLIASYGAVFLFVPGLRKVPLELLAVRRAGKAKPPQERVEDTE